VLNVLFTDFNDLLASWIYCCTYWSVSDKNQNLDRNWWSGPDYIFIQIRLEIDELVYLGRKYSFKYSQPTFLSSLNEMTLWLHYNLMEPSATYSGAGWLFSSITTLPRGVGSVRLVNVLELFQDISSVCKLRLRTLFFFRHRMPRDSSIVKQAKHVFLMLSLVF